MLRSDRESPGGGVGWDFEFDFDLEPIVMIVRVGVVVVVSACSDGENRRAARGSLGQWVVEEPSFLLSEELGDFEMSDEQLF